MSSHRTSIAHALTVAGLLLGGSALAAPGELDLSFGGFGSQAIRTHSGGSAAMVMAPDGKIVTVGTSGSQIVVRRYLPNGTPDPSFGGDGDATFLNQNFAMRANAVALQTDGKIVVAGVAFASTNDFLVMRVTSAGGLDFGFGSGGYQTTDFAGAGDIATAVVVQPDGRIVLAGTSKVGGDDDFSVARYTSGGLLDVGFSGDGRLTIGFGGDDVCADAALQDDGKIVLVGDGSDSFPFYDRDICVARLLSDGSLDGTFDGDGKRTAGLGGWDVATAVAVQPDGRIVVAGYVEDQDHASKVIRFTPGGANDVTLDADGVVQLPESVDASDLVVQPDGRIVVISNHFQLLPVIDRQIAVHRILTNGVADGTFGGDGRAFYDVGATDIPRSVALLPDGRVQFLCTSGPDGFEASQNTTHLMRLWQDGTPDAGGQQALGFPETTLGSSANERAAGMAIQADGKIVVAGELWNSAFGEADFGIARFLANGEVDPAFGTDGRMNFNFHNTDIARAVAVQPDGKIVVAGHTGSGAGVNFLVARFNPDGSLDTSFGFSGFNVLDFLGGPDYAQAVAIAPDGKIVVAGTVYNGASYVFGVCRFTAGGFVDTSFDLDGKQLHQLIPGTSHWVSSVLVQPDLEIVLGGQLATPFDGSFVLSRYHESGAVDLGFGLSGWGYSIFDMGGVDYLAALAVGPGGLMYTAGNSLAGGNNNFAVAQVGADGVVATCEALPCATWPTGRAYVDWGGDDAAYTVDVRSDGHVVVAGIANGQFGWAEFDPTSSTPVATGRVDFAGTGEVATAVRFAGVNHVVLAGTQDFNGNQNFALARFETTPIAALAVGDPEVGPPHDAMRLFPPVPNPMTRSVRLSFELPRPLHVKLAIHDVSGRRVRTLSEGLRAAGRHEMGWDGTDGRGGRVRAGVYFVTVEVGADRSIEKLVVLE